MTKRWNIELNDNKYSIEYKAMFGIKVTVNGQTQKLKSQSYLINIVDCPIGTNGDDLRLVVIGNKVDIAVNGVYHDSGREYKPLEGIPKQAKIFTAISVIGGLLLSGALGALIGVFFGVAFMNLGLKQKKGALTGAFIVWILIEILLLGLVSYLYALPL